MNYGGWIKLHRVIMEHPDWLSEPFTRAQAWIDLLLLANHKTGHIRKRGITITVERGQVGYSEDALASRWRWSRGKVRRYLSELTRLSQVSRKISEKTVQKNTSVSSLIYIVNYEKYQMDDTEDGMENGRKTVQEQEEKEGKEKTLCDFSPKISALKDRYPDQETINQAFTAIQSTRKSNRIADSVKFSILKAWERYPVESVMAGIKTFLEKGYHNEGKREKYLLGIIRNNGNGNHRESEITGGQVMKSTGSHALDEHYRSQGIRII